VSPVRYELGLYTPEDDILHSHRCENLKSYNGQAVLQEPSYYRSLLVHPSLFQLVTINSCDPNTQ
jgi:hypothetical protein